MHCDTVTLIKRGYDISKRHDTGHIDLPGLTEGGVNIQVFAVCTLGMDPDQNPKSAIINDLELLKSAFSNNHNSIEICLGPADLNRIRSDDKIAAILAIEGGIALENNPENIQFFHDRGVRILTITHDVPVGWCTNWKDDKSKNQALTDLGRDMISELNHQGIIIDVSHASDKTVDAVLEISDSPIIASHSCARSICQHGRNLPDRQIKAIAESGGMIGVTFVNPFLSAEYNQAFDQFWKTVPPGQLKKLIELYTAKIPEKEYQKALEKDFSNIIEGENKLDSLRATVKTIANHIDHMVEIAGPDHVGIGSDFDGISSTPIGLEDCSKLPNLTGELLKRGYDPADIAKIMGENFIRILKRISAAE